jgi:hypothetical protein
MLPFTEGNLRKTEIGLFWAFFGRFSHALHKWTENLGKKIILSRAGGKNSSAKS